MLTKEQYEALCEYRDFVVPAGRTRDEITAHLCEKNLVAIKRLEFVEQGVFYEKAVWTLTADGKLAIKEFEDFADNTRKEAAKKNAEDRANRHFQTRQTILNAIICAVVGFFLGLIADHFAEIANFIISFFH